MSTRSKTVRLVCTECKRKVSGSASTPYERGCDHCGGQLKVIPYGPRYKRSK